MDADDQVWKSSSTTMATTVGFNLLPTDLIHNILLQLPLPEIPNLWSVSKPFQAITSDPSFLQLYNSKCRNVPWLFIYTKRWGQNSILKGITAGFDRWFSFSIHDLYFLTSCGNFFLFAINTSKELVYINLMNKSVKRIPPSPLGPRDTSSWRRSGMKLVTQRSGGCDHFRFFFLECFLENKMYLFEYDSLTEMWRLTDVQEHCTKYNLISDEMKQNGFIFLTMFSSQGEHITLVIGMDKDMTLFIISPLDGMNETAADLMRIYGDGAMLKLKSSNMSGNKRKKITVRIELWVCLSSSGMDWHWEMISIVPKELLIMKPFGVMRGSLERENGIVRGVLMSNYEGSWEIIWLSYELEKRKWTCTLLPDCKMKEANMGGIGFSSGLTLS